MIDRFPFMVLASLLVFLVVIRMVMGVRAFRQKLSTIALLSLVVVVMGMLIGRYGAQIGLKWWIYYPIPMLITVLLPPMVLKMNRKQTLIYLLLSFSSAPVIHAFFSFCLGWNEYMPFWEIPYFREL